MHLSGDTAAPFHNTWGEQRWYEGRRACTLASGHVPGAAAVRTRAAHRGVAWRARAVPVLAALATDGCTQCVMRGVCASPLRRRWRSWNLYGARVNQPLITGIMDGVVKKGANGVSLADMGYTDVGLDGQANKPRSPLLEEDEPPPSASSVPARQSRARARVCVCVCVCVCSRALSRSRSLSVWSLRDPLADARTCHAARPTVG